LSGDGHYRYELWRQWAEPEATNRFVTWIMLNPSTADAEKDDPTIRRVVGFSKAWGYDGCMVVNLFALRATNPRALAAHPDPVGPENDETLLTFTKYDTVAAWGAHKMAEPRQRWLLEHLDGSPLTLGMTKGGFPKHPLYVPADTPATPWARKGDSTP
jgi:hypothetical protein